MYFRDILYIHLSGTMSTPDVPWCGSKTNSWSCGSGCFSIDMMYVKVIQFGYGAALHSAPPGKIDVFVSGCLHLVAHAWT